MSEKVRIRTSKWDMVEEIHEPIQAKQENIQLDNIGTAASNWSAPKITDIDNSNTSNVDRGASGNPGDYDKEPENVNNSKTGAYNRETRIQQGGMSFDPVSVTREQDDQNSSKLRDPRWSELEDGKRDKSIGKASGWHRIEDDHNEIKDAAGWGSSLSQSHHASISPGNTEWRHHSRSISPRGRRNHPYRSRSRSWSRSRSLSRSRSPIPQLRKESDGWNDRVRQLSGAPGAYCRAFAAGRCQRGTLCRYLHEDGDRRRSHRQDDIRDNRYESRNAVSGRKDYVVEPTERRDYVFDKTSHSQRSSHDENWRNRSTQQCYDFKMGRCQRGSACRYLHHDASYREKHGKVGYNDRTYSRESDASSGNARSHEYRQLNDIPCKFFAVGNCRNGNKCKFSHQNQGLAQNPAGGVSFDDKVVWDDENRQLWNDPKFGDQEPEGKPTIPVWTGDKNQTKDFDPDSMDMQMKHATYSQSSGSWKPEQTKYLTSEMSPPTFPVQMNPQSTLQQFNSTVGSKISPGEASVMMPPDNKEKNMLQTDASLVNDGSWNNNMEICTDNQSAGSLTHGQSFYQAGIAQQPNIPSLSPVGQVQSSMSPVFSGSSNQQFSYSLTSNVQEQPASFQDPSNAQVGHVPNVFPSFYSGHNVQPVYALPSGVPAPMAILQPNLKVQGPSGNENIAPITVQGQSQYGNIQPPSGGSAHTAALHPNLNVLRANGIENPTPLPANEHSHYGNIQPIMNLDANRQGLQIPSEGSKQCVTLQLNSVIPTTESKDKPQPIPQQLCQPWPNQEKHTLVSDTPELKTLDSSSESLAGNKVVTSEQIAQLSNLSASLAQIFGNGQQLPQLYASLNPVDCQGLTPSAINQPSSMPPVSAVTSVLQVHMNSTGDSGKPETSHVKSNDPNVILSNLGAKKNNIQDSLVPLQTSTPNLTAGHNNLGDCKNINLEERLKNTTAELNIAGKTECNELLEKKANPLGESKKPEHAEQTEETAADDVTDGDGKKSKDGKGTRLFKNALVEFVKDILKPMWKEGNMSKEAHKTIVKKVVDKVTSVMQSNIPQTQDKVDLYLSHSKAKLTKLVQAYVEKYSKL